MRVDTNPMNFPSKIPQRIRESTIQGVEAKVLQEVVGATSVKLAEFEEGKYDVDVEPQEKGAEVIDFLTSQVVTCEFFLRVPRRFVLAGTHAEFMDYTRHNPQVRTQFVYGKHNLYGLRRPQVVLYGTYYLRKDRGELEDVLRCTGAVISHG